MPIMICVWPLFRRSRTESRSFPLIPPVRSSTFNPAFFAIGAMVVASISVGTINADGPPDSDACAMASIATTVFPEPTSP